MASPQTAPRIRVAIVGGGFAGATTALATYQNPLLDVHLFEASPVFTSRGAAIGIDANSTRCLHEMFPDASDMLRRAKCVEISIYRWMMGHGPDAGKPFMGLDDEGDAGSQDKDGDESDAKRVREAIVHRGSLLQQLLAPLPKDMLHPNKKLADMTRTDGGQFQLTFTDGAVELFDTVIGADGIHSQVRKYVLADWPEHCTATPAGFWDCRFLVPYDQAVAALSRTNFDKDRQCGWVGKDAFTMHDVIENGEIVHCVLCGVEKETPTLRKRPLTREFLTECFKEWMDGPIAPPMIELFLTKEGVMGYSQYEHVDTPTYTRGSACIIGDAAHCSTPWQGAGCGQAFEDALVLSRLFQDVRSAADLEAAYKAFDEVRRPRAQQLVTSSHGSGLIMTLQGEHADLCGPTVKEALSHRWDFIYALDHKEHVREAVEKFKGFLAA